MNELICVLVFIGLIVISIPITWLVLKTPDLIHEIVETIKWNIRRWNDHHDD